MWSHDVLPHLLGLRGTSTYVLTVLLAVAAAGLPRTVLAVAGIVALAAAFAVWSLAALGDLKGDLHETGWSIGLLEWLPLAGALGAVLRSRRLGVALLGWLGFFVLRAAEQTYADGSFWIALEPGPAGGRRPGCLGRPACAAAQGADGGRPSELSFSSSRAIRWARITFWSESFEITVE